MPTAANVGVMETTLNTETLEERIFQTRQAWNFLGIYKVSNGRVANPDDLPTKKVKIEVKVDSYPFQSFAHCSIWSVRDEKWNLVAEIPYPEMESINNISYVDKSAYGTLFEDDINVLMSLAKAILF